MAISNDWPPPEFANQLSDAAGTTRRFECQAVGYGTEYIVAGTALVARTTYATLLNIDLATVVAVPSS